MDVRIIGGMVLVCAIVVVVGVLFYDYDFNPGVTDDSGSTGNSTNAPGNTTTPINQLSSTLPAVNPSPSVGPSPNPNPGPSPTPTMDMAKVVQIMDQYLRSIFPQTHIPGLAIAIVQNGKVYYINTLGVKNVTTGEGVTPDTIFQIGSLSKAFTATYIEQLVDKGKLSFESLFELIGTKPANLMGYNPDPEKYHHERLGAPVPVLPSYSETPNPYQDFWSHYELRRNP